MTKTRSQTLAGAMALTTFALAVALTFDPNAAWGLFSSWVKDGGGSALARDPGGEVLSTVYAGVLCGEGALQTAAFFRQEFVLPMQVFMLAYKMAVVVLLVFATSTRRFPGFEEECLAIVAAWFTPVILIVIAIVLDSNSKEQKRNKKA